MKLPRSVSGERLVRTLQQVGYSIIRQRGAMSGFSIRDHRFTVSLVPLHNPLKTGTLHAILAEVALMRSMTLESLAQLL